MVNPVLTEDQLAQLPEEELQELLEQIKTLGPVATFPWHSQQEHVLRAATNVVCAIGGNQSGKTTVGRGVVSRLVRREGPVYRRLKSPRGRALRIWLSPQTFEKYKSNWEQQVIQEVFRGIDYEYVQSPIPKFTWRDEHGGGDIWGKSQDQGFLAFESDVVDLIVFDEEPMDRRIYSSSVARLSTTNGVILFTFTPLHGLSWTHSEFFLPCVKDKYRLDDRAWRHGNSITVILMGMADNPRAVAGGGVARIRDNPAMSEAEKATRLYGTYGYTEGMIWKQLAALHHQQDSPYFFDELPEDRTYEWIMTVDPNKRHGGLLSAVDHQGICWVVDEHYAEGFPDRIHADEYKRMLRERKLKSERVDFYADPGGAGAQAIINLSDLGIDAARVPKDPGSVKASIELVRRALMIDRGLVHPITGTRGSPRLFFRRDLMSRWTQAGVEYRESRLFWELRQYRQKPEAPPDTPIKESDDLVDCLRYLYLARPMAPVQPAIDQDKLLRADLDPVSRREHDAYDKIAARVRDKRPRKLIDETLGYV